MRQVACSELKLIFLIFCSSFVVAINAEDYFDYSDCPADFQQIGEKCYMIEKSEPKNWFQAHQMCRSRNADLLTIENEQEMNAISDHLMENGCPKLKDCWYWTAANDLGTEGVFYWHSNGKPMTYERFDMGEPNDRRRNEDCIALWYATQNGRNRFEMNDYDCTKMRMYVCETALKSFGCVHDDEQSTVGQAELDELAINNSLPVFNYNIQWVN